MDSVSKKLRDLRADHDLTQHDVARALGISQAKLSYLENGQEIPIPLLIDICKYFDVSADYMLGFSNSPQASSPDAHKIFNSLFAADPDSFSMNDVLTLARQFQAYYAAGAPAGAAPMQCFKGVLAAMGGVLSAASAKDIAALLIQANALGSCCLQANEILAAFMDRQKS
jgi:transcriptional regulator with XRE-family HTH domain